MRIDVVVPRRWDDPRHPTGGNHYDQRVIAHLRGRVDVRVHVDSYDAVADGATVLVDGLLGSSDPAALLALAGRTRAVVLVHMPFGVADPAARCAEREAFAAAYALVVPSEYAKRWLVDSYGTVPERVHVAAPGVDAAPASRGTTEGNSLLCLANVHPGKGQDVLVAALSQITDLAWNCRVVGATDRDPAFVDAVITAIDTHGLGDRVGILGVRIRAALDAIWDRTDLLVLPTRGETYGMVLAEAVARGVPVVVSDVGGVREAVGPEAGLLVPPGDPAALAAALRAWLSDSALRSQLRRAAVGRVRALHRWSDTARTVLGALR